MNQQEAFFATGVTLDMAFRKEAIRRIAAQTRIHEQKLYLAFLKDLGKPQFEVYATEVGVVYKHIQYILKHMNRKLAPQCVMPSLLMGQKSAHIHKSPKGHGLIIAPFNYPFQLAILPLIDALACGNVVTLKLSEYTPHINAVIRDIVSNSVSESYVCVVEGGAYETQVLLETAYDHIFFTGSPKVGSIIMKRAANHLTPVTLELGGKSPVIIDETADIKHAAQAIMWGKCLNTGQTCVAPDTLYIKKGLEEAFIKEARACLIKMYTQFPEMSHDYGRIVTVRHAERLRDMLQTHEDKIVYGGRSWERFVEPTLLLNAQIDEEIFGPILPIMTYTHIDEVDAAINNQPYPLAIYLFTKDKHFIHHMQTKHRTGALMINQLILHAGSENVPFGGVRYSGMGQYHGKHSFETWTLQTPVIHNMKYTTALMTPPYNTIIHNINIFRKILK